MDPTVPPWIRRSTYEGEAMDVRERTFLGVGFDALVAKSKAMKELVDKLRKCAATNRNVFIFGENGTGKKLIASIIHNQSLYREKPFVRISCSAMTPDLVDVTLFGDEYYGKPGKLEEANGGTLLLEEIAHLTPIAQSKLLQVLQEGSIERRSGAPLPVDFRIISTSSVLTDNMLDEFNFQKNLFFKLNTLPLRVPSLKERIEDIPYLANIFINEICRQENISKPSIPFHYIELLMKVEWTGNIIQLRNHLESVMVLADGEFDPETIYAQFQVQRQADPTAFLKTLYERIRGGEKVILDSVLSEIEYSLVKKSLEYADGNQSRAAKLVGLNEQKIRRIMSKHGMKLKRSR
jgi:DNA-binding NtrC family response regulator